MEAEAQAAASKVDKSLSKEEALDNALIAIDLYMNIIKNVSNNAEKVRLRSKCNQLLSRAEEIKKASHWQPSTSNSAFLKAPLSSREISTREQIILLEGSKLHGFIFPPWKLEPEDTVFEEPANGNPFYIDSVDLKLSESQEEIFAGWKRPAALLEDPKSDGESTNVDDLLMTSGRDDIDLVQDITTDCSVVASLCAGTARGLKGHGRLLASIFYPYDNLKGRPRVSKNGKYIFRLNFNGCSRRVTIDDRLPSSNTSRCLHVLDRNNPDLLWPALLEKAYLKVRGGYDFPGSNSGTDLWVMTGWIPEQVFLQSDDLEPMSLWNRVFMSFGYGDVIITLGTGSMSRKEEKELGLVGEHDYAILDMKEVGHQRLLLIKNPWCDGMVWKGKLLLPDEGESSDDWTQGLAAALPKQTNTAPGTFWMSLEDVAQHFESLYLNWNPGLFKFRQDHHFSWKIPLVGNPGSFMHNPQYSFTSQKGGTVWVLLSRHFATQEHDIALNSTPIHGTSNCLGFISLYAFSETCGQRIYLSDDALHRGAYVDSPQTLARLEVDASTTYTVVCAQQGLPLPKYSFTLSFFSRSPLDIDLSADSLPHFTSHAGSWTPNTAGGNSSASTYPLNPQFSIDVPSPTPLTLILETTDPELAVHVKIVYSNGSRVSSITKKDILVHSGDYRRGCALTKIPLVEKGKYTIVCSTFESGQTGDFSLRIGSSIPCSVQPIPAETAGRRSTHLPILIFHPPTDRLLAPLTIHRLTKILFVVRSITRSSQSRPLLRISIERGQGPNKTVLDVSGNGEFQDPPMGIRSRDLDLSPGMGERGGLWVVVERLGGRAGADRVEVEVLSDERVEVGAWGVGEG
ncbi:Cysteine proteinase [Glarea lozoyensis ATCC 20868]|uniref:Cysteine proteinase n=1 Tax=Glarea lozoyensis (strain ATCC 20868 / MF5171) TaxID=1116229 RepID=S3DCE7_GLAL2|nr:Cysteine proteinase [Glarea lozoyensis ATCC 20868]EPE36102.1 Cysteine proteinase [Glarea lozoyensis ATCC 20868]